ncbi:S-adenosyl-L-methionine-dependent methyltransferase [Dactylonectria macrodidyma]|uniref:S-adenosyl-L-methionine-dependent methyltransferase n=1 Tax=Dactylonectria macrodidyma TaxID=307937 RepID=A0A9P9ID89_9HYPO|nr:S-adenosyl-L-methionine-dependent methyltransferase [Dactylonectria macrodidyma]
MSSHNNEKPDKGILVQRTFTMIEESPFKREVQVWSDSPPPSSAPTSLTYLLGLGVTTANHLFRESSANVDRIPSEINTSVCTPMQQPAEEAALALRPAGGTLSKTLQPLPNVTDHDEPSSDAGHAADDASGSQPRTGTADDDDPHADPGDEENLYGDGDPDFDEDAMSSVTMTGEVERKIINDREYGSAFWNVYPWTPTDETYCEVLDIKHAATNAYWEILDIKHVAANACPDPKLCRAPDERRHQVLDVGTGTGIWAIEYAEENPWAAVIGFDICPIQPQWVPPNLTFELDDFNLEWTWKRGIFDYIHARDLTGSIDNWSHFFGEAFKCLKPDGYLETHEQSFRLIHQASGDPVDPTTQSLISALNRWNKVFSDLGKRLDRPFLAVDHRTQMDLMMKAGFTDLKVWRKWMPIGPWAEDLELPATELGWSPHEATMLGMEIRKALRSPKLNVKVKVVVIVGRKPGQL